MLEVAQEVLHSTELTLDADLAHFPGFDSLAGTELANKLNVKYGIELPKTLVFDAPTVVDIAVLIAGEFAYPAAPVRPLN